MLALISTKKTLQLFVSFLFKRVFQIPSNDTKLMCYNNPSVFIFSNAMVSYNILRRSEIQIVYIYNNYLDTITQHVNLHFLWKDDLQASVMRHTLVCCE